MTQNVPLKNGLRAKLTLCYLHPKGDPVIFFEKNFSQQIMGSYISLDLLRFGDLEYIKIFTQRSLLAEI